MYGAIRSKLDSDVLYLLLQPGIIFITTISLATVTSQTSIVSQPFSALAALPLLFVLPGYAIVSVLFSPGQAAVVPRRGGAIYTIERLALSVIGSVLATTFTGFGLVFSPFELNRWNVVVVLTLVITVAVVFLIRDQLQKLNTPADRKRRWGINFASEWQRQPLASKIVTVMLLTGILCAIGATSYTLTTEVRGEQYTEFYLLTENESGQLVADDYPTEFTEGETRLVTVGVANNEQSTVSYSVVVELQRLQGASDEARVVTREELTRYQTRLRPTEASNRTVQLEPTMEGDKLRLAFLLYIGEPPADPSEESAYRDIHLWITVSPPE